MILKKTFFVLLLVCAYPVWGQLIKKKTGLPVLFTIQGEPVLADEFIQLYRKNHTKAEDFDEQKIGEYINLFVNFKLKVTEARARGIDTTAAFLKEFKTYKDELKRPFTVEKGELDKLTNEVYQRSLVEINATHLLITVKPDALPRDTLIALNKINQIREKILQGVDFGKAATEFSEDPSAKSNHGNLGYFTTLQMVYPFEQAAYNLKVGEISQPVRTRFGYHLIKVIDRRPARGEVEVSHILLRTGAGDETRVKNKIFEIEEQLQGGRSWDELCKEYSDDPSTKDKGGRLRPFGVGAIAGIPEFEETAFSLKEPGEISDPFKSGYGWHLIRLERKIPPPPFKDVEAALQRKLSRDERIQAVNARLLNDKKKKFQFSENTDVKTQLLSTADSSVKKGMWRFNGNSSINALTLFSLGDRKIDAADFVRYQKNQVSSANQSAQVVFNQWYENFVADKLNDAEENKLMTENPEFKSLAIEYKEGILLFTIMEKEVWNKASQDTVGQEKYYRENSSKFQTGNRVTARIFSSTDKDFMDAMMKKVMAGDTIKNEEAKKFKTTLQARNYAHGDNKAVDKVQWLVGAQMTELDGTYYLIAIDNLVPPGVKSLNEVRAQVISDYQDVLEKTWVSELKQKYPVKINNKGKKYVIKELTNK